MVEISLNLFLYVHTVKTTDISIDFYVAKQDKQVDTENTSLNLRPI